MAVAERIVDVGQELNPEAVHKEIAKSFGEKYKKLVMACLKGLGVDLPEEQVFCEPHPHLNSDAIYIADFYTGNDRVLVSYLRPNSHTSPHHHEKPIIEEYYSCAGLLYLNGEQVPPEGLIIWPSGRRRKSRHQATTGENGALTVIRMKNARLVPPERQHIRLSAA